MTGPCPDEVVSLYVGETTHHRFHPRPHRFAYRLFQILVDIDRIETERPGAVLLRRGRWGLFSYDRRDHGARDGSRLRDWVEARLKQAGAPASAHTIRLLCFPRVLGFVFNPLSIFFVHDAAGRLEAVIYEVNNTFGQTHAYVVPARGDLVELQEADKVFYVSPFYRVEGGYRFRLTPPDARFALTVLKQVDGKPDFIATQTAERRPLTDRALLGLFLSMPIMTLGVVFAIHWQAVRLWLKGAPFGARPPGPKAASSLGRLAVRPSRQSDPSSIVSDPVRSRAVHERF
jgi:DUF1365 family protein